MKNALYLLMISLLVLAGCDNQGLESREQSIDRTQQVKVNLGEDSSSRSSRYKGTYDDVLNGGSVKLRYSFDGAEGRETQIVGMTHNGNDWTVSLTLAIGDYTFSAEARNKDGVKIFNTPTPVDHEIVPGTTSLSLGLQLEPIMEDGADSIPMPTITQITKPAGYWPGGKLGIGFEARGGIGDNLEFVAEAYNTNNETVARVESTFTPTDDDGTTAVYNDKLWLDIPANTEGDLAVEFYVWSDALQMGSTASFIVQGAVNLTDAGGVVFLMPFASEFALVTKENDPDNLTVYLALTGNHDFDDSLTFAYDDNTLGASYTITETGREMDDDGIREKVYALLTRDEVDEAGTLTLTFTHMNDSSISYTQTFPVGAGTTGYSDNTSLMSPPKVNSINNELLGQNRESGVMLIGQLAPGGSYADAVPSVEVADGSVWFFEPASGHTAMVQIDLASADTTITESVLVSADQGNSVYLPRGDYYMALTSAAGGDYRISVHYQPTNVVAGSATLQSPVEMYDDHWSDSSDVKEYQVYLTGDRRLNFMEANSTPGTIEYELSFCLTNGYDTYGCSDHREPMYIDSTEESGPSPGWWTFKVTAPRAPYSGSWAVYETEAGVDLVNYTNSIHTPDDFKYKLVPGEQFWLNTSGMQSYSLQLDCSYDLWIYTNNSAHGWGGSWTSSGLKLTVDQCNSVSGYTTLSLDPDANGEVNFGLHLKPPPPPLQVTIGDQFIDNLTSSDVLQITEGSSYDFQVNLNRPLEDGEWLDVDVVVNTSNHSSWVTLEPLDEVWTDDSGSLKLRPEDNAVTRNFRLKVWDDEIPGKLFGYLDSPYSGEFDAPTSICFDIYADADNVALENNWCVGIEFVDSTSTSP